MHGEGLLLKSRHCSCLFDPLWRCIGSRLSNRNEKAVCRLKVPENHVTCRTVPETLSDTSIWQAEIVKKFTAAYLQRDNKLFEVSNEEVKHRNAHGSRSAMMR